MTPCDCGFGNGFYHSSKTGVHEYNPCASIERACARLESDRLPKAKFFGHINGGYVQAIVNGRILRFSYEQYGHGCAFQAAARFILSETRQLDLFA